MAWTDFSPGTEKTFPGFQNSINVDEEYGWVHYLVAPLDEKAPDKNHIHLKCKIATGEWVVSSVKVDGIRVINRRELIDGVNRVTGLNLKYR